MADLPQAISLPAVDDHAISVLANTGSDVTIALLTNSEDLALQGARIVFNGSTVAGVRFSEGRVEFRWVEASSDAAAALSRSLLMLTVGNERRAIALSEPRKLAAQPIGLKNRLIRLKYECNDLTPIEDIRFALTAELPEHAATGDDLLAMAGGDDALIAYPFADETIVDTKVRVWKSGDAIIVDIDSRFQLPSGYEKPLTIAEGALRLKKLDSLLGELEAAPARMQALIADLSVAEDALRYANRMPSYDPNSIAASNLLAASKQRAVNAAERQGFRIADDIAYVQDLLANEQMINRDHRAINAIAEFSHLLRDVPLRYRFYVLVGGEQHDLVVAE